jgi:hypothetical protein
MKKSFLLFGLLLYIKIGFSQVLIMNTIEGVRNPKLDYEYGYLPGRKFPFYQTLNKYDLKVITPFLNGTTCKKKMVPLVYVNSLILVKQHFDGMN